MWVLGKLEIKCLSNQLHCFREHIKEDDPIKSIKSAKIKSHIFYLLDCVIQLIINWIFWIGHDVRTVGRRTSIIYTKKRLYKYIFSIPFIKLCWQVSSHFPLHLWTIENTNCFLVNKARLKTYFKHEFRNVWFYVAFWLSFVLKTGCGGFDDLVMALKPKPEQRKGIADLVIDARFRSQVVS